MQCTFYTRNFFLVTARRPFDTRQRKIAQNEKSGNNVPFGEFLTTFSWQNYQKEIPIEVGAVKHYEDLHFLGKTK